jgi:uncharacterized membrane protein YfcA
MRMANRRTAAKLPEYVINDPTTLAAILATFLLAGSVKGVVGLGLPTISLAILTVVLDLASAMALLLIPSFVTNFLQGATGGHGRMLLRRLWPFLLLATIMVGLSGLALGYLDHTQLRRLLGLLIIIYAGISLFGWRPSISTTNERWLGPVMGVLNGIFTGMTGSFVVPGVLYLNAIGLPRDALVQAMGILFALATLALAVMLGAQGMLTLDLGLGSLVGLPPALIGMAAGQRLRKRLSEALFRKVLFWALLAMGLYIVA